AGRSWVSYPPAGRVPVPPLPASARSRRPAPMLGSILSVSEREVIPVWDLERADVRKLVREAAVILAIDRACTSTGTDGMLIYGRALLKDMRNGQAAEWGPQRVLFFSLDSESDEPEYLCATVRVLKGRHGYAGGTDPLARS